MNTKNYCCFLPAKEDITATLSMSMVAGIDGCLKPILRWLKSQQAHANAGALFPVTVHFTVALSCTNLSSVVSGTIF